MGTGRKRDEKREREREEMNTDREMNRARDEEREMKEKSIEKCKSGTVVIFVGQCFFFYGLISFVTFSVFLIKKLFSN